MSGRKTSRTSWPQRLLWTLLVIVFLAPISWNIYDHLTRPPRLQDERTAMLQLLASKFAGAEYFQIEAPGGAPPATSGKVCITAASAKAQVARVAAARKLSPERITRLNDLITRMTEPPSSRVVGGDRVNLLLLNVATDAL